jgi:hypothetical protein
VATVTRVGRGVTVLAGLGTVAVLATGSTAAAGFAAVGTLLVALAPRWPRRAAADAGGVGLFVGLLVAGAGGLAAPLLLVATLGAVLAWDGGSHAVGLATQLEPESQSGRGELVHAGLTLVVTAGIAGVAYVTYLVGRGRLPLVAGVLVALGAVLVTLAIDPAGD